jgi:hypothetical protein
MTTVTKTKRSLRTYLEEFVNRIPHSNGLQSQDILDNCFVAGGSITSLFSNEKPNDIDIYFKDATLARYVLYRLLANYRSSNLPLELITASNYANNTMTVQAPRTSMPNAAEVARYERVSGISYVSPNAVSIKTPKNSPGLKGIPAQLIFRFVGQPQDVIGCFDFAHTYSFYNYATDELVISQKALLAQSTKQLLYEGSLFPLTSIARTRKFLSRGWSCSAGQMLKIMLQAATMDWTSMDVLRDQLKGVDTIYFDDLLNELEQEFPDNQVIPTPVLIEKIERIFV